MNFIKLIAILICTLVVISSTNAQQEQFKFNNDIKFSENQYPNTPGARIALGFNLGLAYYNDASGLAVGMLADIRISNFSIIPQANYWKVNESTNFEMAAIMRFRFESKSVTPYIDGGFGVNFYESNIKDGNDGITKLGLDIGGGIEIPNVFNNALIFIDGKYKIIINDSPNIKGYTLTAGIKFDL